MKFGDNINDYNYAALLLVILNKNITIDKALSTIGIRPRNKNTVKLSETEKNNIKELADKNCINYNTVMQRIRSGWSIEKSTTTPLKKRYKFPKWVYENLNKYKIDYSVFMNRIYHKWDIYEACTTPTGRPGRRKHIDYMEIAKEVEKIYFDGYDFATSLAIVKDLFNFQQ